MSQAANGGPVFANCSLQGDFQPGMSLRDYPLVLSPRGPQVIGNGRHLSGSQKFDANERRDELFAAASWCSLVSGQPLGTGTPQLAHRLANTNANLAKFGPEVLHHALNLVPVRDLKENARVLIHAETEPGRALVARIRRILAGEEPELNMAEEYRALREEFAR